MLKPALRSLATSAAAAQGDLSALSLLWRDAVGYDVTDDDPSANAADLYRYIGEWIEEHVREDDSLSINEEEQAIKDAREILGGNRA